MAVLPLKTTFTKTIKKSYTRMKFIGLWAYYVLDLYLQTPYMYLCMAMKFK